MLHLIGILVLSSHGGGRNQNGFVEASFANTSAGVEALIEFAENSLRDLGDDDGANIIIGRLDDTADRDLLIGKLASLGIPHGYATSTAIRACAERYKLVEYSPKAVALAFRRPAGTNRPNLPAPAITTTQPLDVGDAVGPVAAACGHGCFSANSHRYRSDEMAESFASSRKSRSLNFVTHLHCRDCCRKGKELVGKLR